jgi:aprataxin
MRPKLKPTPDTGVAYSRGNPFKSRDGLGAYIVDPASYPPSRVISMSHDFVAINDLYPKSTVHTLLLPRDLSRSLLHPFDAFDDPKFLASVQNEVLNLRKLVAKELERRYGKESQADAKRQAILNGDIEPEGNELPVGRNWDAEVITGIHAHPSMNHLHVHVLSRDMFSESLRHRKHYNSFNTPFLVDVADFPLGKDDPRRHPGREGYMDRDLVCWRCGKNFGNKFKSLKEHLAEEFAEWKKL